MSKQRTVYLAYGSNLNISQIAWRCPNAKPWGATVLADWKLTFWGGRYVNAMVYIMNQGKINIPSTNYFTKILGGYRDFSINPESLFRALSKAQKKRFQM